MKQRFFKQDGKWYADVPNHMLWLCNVTHDVFGEHPNSIFVNKIEF